VCIYEPLQGTSYLRGRFRTVDLLVRIACFSKKKDKKIPVQQATDLKATDLSQLVLGGQSY
jgi:hypothetical protein